MINQEINVKYHNMTKTRKFIKKIQKKSGEDGCSRMYRHRGGGCLWSMRIRGTGYTAYCSVAQRFAALVCSVVDGFKRGKTRQRKVHAIHREDKNKVLTYCTI